MVVALSLIHIFHTAGHFLPRTQALADQEVDDRTHDSPVVAVGLAMPDQGREFRRVRVIAKDTQIGIHQQPIDRVIAVDRVGMFARSNQAQIDHLAHDFLLVVGPGMEGGEVARELSAGWISLWIVEATEIVGAKLPAAHHLGRRPVGLADQSARELVEHTFRLRLPRRVPGQHQRNTFFDGQPEGVALEERRIDIGERIPVSYTHLDVYKRQDPVRWS